MNIPHISEVLMVSNIERVLGSSLDGTAPLDAIAGHCWELADSCGHKMTAPHTQFMNQKACLGLPVLAYRTRR